MLKACSYFVLLLSILTILFVPDPKTVIPSLMFRGALQVFTFLEPESHPSGMSREWRGMDKLFRTFKMGAKNMDANDPRIFDQMTKDMDGFPLLAPARLDVDVHSFWCEPPNSQDERVYLYFHGGGMHAGQAWQEFGCSDELSFRARAKLLTVDYRLMGKVTTREAVSDMIAAYKWLLTEKKYKPEQIVITGCSGGGMASLLTGLQIVASGLPNPRRVIAGSPGMGLELVIPGAVDNPLQYRDLPSVKDELENDLDAMLEVTPLSDKMAVNWAKNSDYVLPLLNNASGIAKTLIYSGKAEVLASSIELGVAHFKKQGADVTFDFPPHVGHCFGSFVQYPEGAKYMQRMVDFAWE